MRERTIGFQDRECGGNDVRPEVRKVLHCIVDEAKEKNLCERKGFLLSGGM
jgi:hypothetical protein